MYEAIPDIEEPRVYAELEICNSPFVEVPDGEIFDVKMQYPLLKMENAEKRCLIRKGAYLKLVEAQKLLPEGIKFRIWDAWRPFKLQVELYEKYSKNIIKQFNIGEENYNVQKRVVEKFVSVPEENEKLPPVHTTGGAIDLTLVDSTGKELNMGTGFDVFLQETCTSYYEQNANIEIRNNRRILYQAMIKAGFTNLPSEWWHYDYGDRFWAFYNQRPAIYQGVFNLGEVRQN